MGAWEIRIYKRAWKYPTLFSFFDWPCFKVNLTHETAHELYLLDISILKNWHDAHGEVKFFSRLVWVKVCDRDIEICMTKTFLTLTLFVEKMSKRKENIGFFSRKFFLVALPSAQHSAPPPNYRRERMTTAKKFPHQFLNKSGLHGQNHR